jgi:hypothetical protein
MPVVPAFGDVSRRSARDEVKPEVEDRAMTAGFPLQSLSIGRHRRENEIVYQTLVEYAITIDIE